MNEGEIDRKMQSKICLNIALLRSQLGNYQEAIIMHFKSIDHMEEVKTSDSSVNDDLRDQYILLANS